MSLLNLRRKGFGPWVFLVMLVVLSVGAWSIYRTRTLSISEARVKADMITIRSEVDGRIVRVPARLSVAMRGGDVLAMIGTDDAELAVASLEQNVDAAQQLLVQLESKKQLASAQMTLDTRVTDAEALSARGELQGADAAALDAERRKRRGEELLEARLLSRADLDALRRTYDVELARRRTAEADLYAAELKAQRSRADNRQLDLIDADIAIARSRLNEAKVRLQVAELHLSKHTVRAPFPIVVDRNFVNQGDYVQKGQRLFVVHAPATRRVEANVKEFQLHRIVPGAHALIHLDAYPDIELHGTVARIGTASLSEYSVLPPDPQTAYIRVAQRIPVEIEVDWKNVPALPGILAEVTITTP